MTETATVFIFCSGRQFSMWYDALEGERLAVEKAPFIIVYDNM